MKLSDEVGQTERIWLKATERKLGLLLNSLGKQIGIDFYEPFPGKPAVEVFARVKVWFLARLPQGLYAELENLELDKRRFELDMVVSLILTITRRKPYEELAELLIKREILQRVAFLGESWQVSTVNYGDFVFTLADEAFEDNKIEELVRQKRTQSGCHECAELMLCQHPEWLAVTAICQKNIVQRYWHSFAQTKEGKVVDLTGNLVMAREEFDILYDVWEISQVKLVELESLTAKSQALDEGGDLFNLLRIAMMTAKDAKKKYLWHVGKKLEFADYDRVHAFLVTKDERVLLRYKNGEARVTGGRLDPEDVSLEGALCRELAEEINVGIDKCDYLGYIEEINPLLMTTERLARFVARVNRIGVPIADPDRGNHWIYGRTLAPIEIAHQEMDAAYPTNREVLKEALKVAREQNYWTELPSQEFEVLNTESHD